MGWRGQVRRCPPTVLRHGMIVPGCARLCAARINARLDDHVDRTADHDEVLNAITLNEDQPPPSIDRCRFSHLQPALLGGTEQAALTSGITRQIAAQKPEDRACDQQKRDNHQCRCHGCRQSRC